jgi:hypothetical protein
MIRVKGSLQRISLQLALVSSAVLQALLSQSLLPQQTSGSS